MSSTRSFPYSSPEQQGISSSAILSFIEAIEAKGLEIHSFMLLRHGQVVAEGWWSPYEANMPHMLFSVSKSFTSTAIGFAVEEGLISVEDFVLSFFPEEVTPEIAENMSEMTVKHLLTMSTGHAEDTVSLLGKSSDGNWVKGFLQTPITHPPGTHFLYNSGATYLLSAILTKITGLRLLDYLTPRLLEPLGIEGATWETCPRGIDAGGWGLRIQTSDIAKFGQFYLQKGNWQGKQLLSENWIQEATSKQISNGDCTANDWTHGYGYQFWQSRFGTYRADGAFGQFCVVMPEQEVVLAITSGENNMQEILNPIWDCLLPAMKSNSLEADPKSESLLKEKIASLALLPPKGALQSPLASRISGIRYQMQDHHEGIQSIQMDFHEKTCTIRLCNRKGEHIIECGMEAFILGETELRSHLGRARIAASGAWEDSNQFVITLRFIETPFYETWICSFDQSRIRLASSVNVSFGPTQRPVIEGTAEHV